MSLFLLLIIFETVFALCFSLFYKIVVQTTMKLEHDVKVRQAGPPPEALTTAVPSQLKARHQRFLRNRQARERIGNVKRDDENGDGVEDVESVSDESVGDESVSGESGESSDESSTPSLTVVQSVSSALRIPPLA